MYSPDAYRPFKYPCTVLVIAIKVVNQFCDHYMMDEIAEDLLSKLEVAKTWDAYIFVQAQPFNCAESKMVNLLDYLSLEFITLSTSSFPSGASLKFSQFENGILSKLDIQRYIISRAQASGTSLKIGHSTVMKKGCSSSY